MSGIALIGAGSMVFTRQVVGDLLQRPATQSSDLRLFDIDGGRLATAERLVRRLIKEAGSAARVTACPSQDDAIRGADYVINTIQVGGLEATVKDFEIPARVGIKQTIADTLGIGGIFRALRTIPPVLAIVRDIERFAPDARLLNYTNPMSMLMMAVARQGYKNAYGLCHSVQYTAESLALYLGEDEEQLDWVAAGINHMAWFLQLEKDGQDLYPALFRNSQRGSPIWDTDAVRFELMHRLGYFVSESSEHNAEYSPFFMPHDQEIARLNIPVNDYLRRSRAYLEEYAELGTWIDHEERSLLMPLSPEYAPQIISALESRSTWGFYANVPNEGLIANLPPWACVEVPCFVNRRRIEAARIGPLPDPLAAMNRQAITVQSLAVEAALTGNLDLVYQAAMMDPLLASVLSLDEIWHLVDALCVAHEGYLPAMKSRRLHSMMGAS